MKKSIMLHELPAITDPDKFHNYKKVLSIDVIDIETMDGLLKLKLQMSKSTVKYNDKLYVPILLKGSPFSFVDRITKGIPYQLIPGMESWIMWEGNLPSMIANKNFYDISAYRHVPHLEFLFENGWLYERFVFPYEHKPLNRKCLNYHLDNTSILTAASLS
jgi:hypothetical protein